MRAERASDFARTRGPGILVRAKSEALSALIKGCRGIWWQKKTRYSQAAARVDVGGNDEDKGRVFWNSAKK
eukprot:15439001-Alexandrium_andersonii.AAC.1